MAVKYILQRCGSKMGLDPSNAQQRAVLLGFLNEAADEIYAQSDMDGSIMEQVFRVNGDQTVSLPATIGQVRAIRELDTGVAWHLNKLRPRYNQVNWIDAWRNIRLKGKQALAASIVNESKVTVTVSAPENPPIVVSISGSTANASSVSEQIVMSVSPQTSINCFTNITSIKKDRVNDCDVVFTDASGNMLATIPNNQLSTQYVILDVSQCPWLPQASGSSDHYVELLYKKALPWLSGDDDEFPATGYDNIIVNKMLQLWGEESDNPEKAQAYDAKATRSMARKHEDENRGTEDMVALVENPHDTLFPRINSGRYTRRYGRTGRFQ